MLSDLIFFVFFFQAEDGIRDHCVTGVQTCALPITGDAAAATGEANASATGEPAVVASSERSVGAGRAAWGALACCPVQALSPVKTITHGASASAHRLVASLVPCFILMRRIDLRYHSPIVLALNSPTPCRPQVRRCSGP